MPTKIRSLTFVLSIALHAVVVPAQPIEMRLIPGGEFEMGDHDGVGEPNERPVHAVYLDPFYMSVYEATNSEYVAYLNAAYDSDLIEVLSGVVYKAGDSEPYCETTGASSHSRIEWDGSTFTITTGKDSHPVVMVSWYGAAAYANWRSTEEGLAPAYDLGSWQCDFDANGYRLPTEAEWEYAARGGSHGPYRKYPWGDDVDGSQANYWESGDPFEAGPYPWTTPVGYYDGGQTPGGDDMVNGYGLYDMSGNVFEWVYDWYDADYYTSSPYDNPHGPADGTLRVVRGGSWENNIAPLRCANRGFDPTDKRHRSGGFRLVRPAVQIAEVFIPGGEFAMGDHFAIGDADERPVHLVRVDPLYMDVYETTNAEYVAFLNETLAAGMIEVIDGVVYKAGGDEPYCNAGIYQTRILWDGASFSVASGKEMHPVIEVSWYGSVAYANWRSEEVGREPAYDLDTWGCDFSADGYRLPTEAEWEYAARGGEDDPYYLYPWGDAIDGSHANYNGSGDPFEGPDTETTPVGYYDGSQIPPGADMANGYGLYDMAGNVWEWVNDQYDASYYENSPYENPTGPFDGSGALIRGGSYGFSVDYLRCAERYETIRESRPHSGGLRLVRPAARCPGDLSGDHVVDQYDLGILLAYYEWGDGGDVDGDGDTDQHDLGILLAHFGEVCD